MLQLREEALPILQQLLRLRIDELGEQHTDGEEGLVAYYCFRLVFDLLALFNLDGFVDVQTLNALPPELNTERILFNLFSLPLFCFSVAKIMLRLGNLQTKMGMFNEALQTYQRALPVTENCFGTESMEAAGVHKAIGQLYLDMVRHFKIVRDEGNGMEKC
jgi:tetratricopeptide (TPR) repeat protein